MNTFATTIATPRVTSHYDVIVVGGRVAGAATGMLLARHGRRVLILDRSRAGTDTMSTHALMRGGVIQLARWSLLDDIIAAGTPPVRRTTFHYGSERLAIDIKSADGIDALYAPRRTILDPLLADAAADAGADLVHEAAVTDLIRERGRVVGVRFTHADHRFAARAALVVGADGTRSTVARLIDAPVIRTGTSITMGSYGYWDDVSTDGYHWVFTADGCCGLIPTNHGQTCVFASASPAQIGRGGLAVINDVVERAAPDLADDLRSGSAPSHARTYTTQPRYLRQAVGDGWALVGDAGYWKDPLSAHGLTDAMRDAELLARAVVNSGGSSRPLRDELEQYQATRDRLSIPLFDITDRIASQEWDQAEIAELLIRLSAAMNDEVRTLTALAPIPPAHQAEALPSAS